MKKVEIKYSNGTKNIVKAYEKSELKIYLKYNNKTIASLLLINIDNVDLYIDKENVVFENCYYDAKLYDNLINDKEILSSLKLNKLFINIFNVFIYVSTFVSMALLFPAIVSMTEVLSMKEGFKLDMVLNVFLSSITLFIIFNILSYLISAKNNKILKNFLKDVTIKEMNICNEKEDDFNNIEKLDYKEKSKDENEIIFKIKEKMEEKLLYK